MSSRNYISLLLICNSSKWNDLTACQCNVIIMKCVMTFCLACCQTLQKNCSLGAWCTLASIHCCDMWLGISVLLWRRCCVERSSVCTYASCTAATPEFWSIHDSTALHRRSPCRERSSTGRWNKQTLTLKCQTQQPHKETRTSPAVYQNSELSCFRVIFTLLWLF